jgi:hypothetical protein
METEGSLESVSTSSLQILVRRAIVRRLSVPHRFRIKVKQNGFLEVRTLQVPAFASRLKHCTFAGRSASMLLLGPKLL